MNLTLSEDQKMIQQTVNEFCTEFIQPIGESIDRDGCIPKSIFKDLAKLDLMGIITGEEYGGSGLTNTEFSVAVQELAKFSASVAVSYSNTLCCANIIEKFGTEEQKNKYLPNIVSGDLCVTLATTEPNGGANWSLTLKSKATKVNENLVLDGRKCFITNAESADLYIVVARTEFSPNPMEFTALMIEKGSQGFLFGKKEEKLGLKGIPNGELIFDSCRVELKDILGAPGDILTKIMPFYGSLYSVSHSAIAAGIAQSAYLSAREYIINRDLTPEMGLANIEGVQAKIADLAADTETVKLLSYRTAFGETVNGPDPMIQMACTKCNDMTVDITNRALVLHGGGGCTKEFPIERLLRDARTLTAHPAVFDFYRLFAGKILLNVPLVPPKK